MTQGSSALSWKNTDRFRSLVTKLEGAPAATEANGLIEQFLTTACRIEDSVTRWGTLDVLGVALLNGRNCSRPLDLLSFHPGGVYFDITCCPLIHMPWGLIVRVFPVDPECTGKEALRAYMAEFNRGFIAKLPAGAPRAPLKCATAAAPRRSSERSMRLSAHVRPRSSFRASASHR